MYTGILVYKTVLKGNHERSKSKVNKTVQQKGVINAANIFGQKNWPTGGF